jgi:hypothetical protein
MLEGAPARRAEAALAHLAAPAPGFDPAAAEARLAHLFGALA